MLKKTNYIINTKSIPYIKIFLYLQPFLDILIGISIKYNKMSFFFSFLRFIFLIYMFYYLINTKKKYINYFLIIFLYSLLYIIVNATFNVNINYLYEIKILIKSFYFPISLLFFYNMKIKDSINLDDIINVFYLYLIFIFVPNLFNFGFNSYSDTKIGSIGFFYSANSIGNLLSILVPFVIYKFLRYRNYFELIIFTIFYIFILFNIGTKSPILCFVLIFAYLFFKFIFNCYKDKKYINLIITFSILFIILINLYFIIPNTPFYKNLVIHLHYLNINSIFDLFTFENFDHFIFSSRLFSLKNTFALYLKSSFLQKMFGMGSFFDGSLIRTCEMDFFCTFFHQGLIGFVIIYFFVFKFLFINLIFYFKNIKINFFNIKKSMTILSILISFLCASIVGHVFDSISLCFIMGIIFNLNLSQKK